LYSLFHGDANMLLSLEQLASEDSFVLFDNNILVGPLQRPKRDSSRNQKLSYVQENIDFYGELIDRIQNGENYFITEGVWEEYRYFRAEVRDTTGRDIKLKNAQKDLTKKRRRLAQEFALNDRIVEIDEGREKELYSELKNYSRKLKRSFGVSKIDLELLFSAAVISNMRGPTSLVSNDFGIYHSWSLLGNEGYFSREQLKYFIKEDFTGYNLLL